MSGWLLLTTTLLTALLAFGLLFVVAWRINNFGIVDIAWAGGFAPAAIFLSLLSHGLPERRTLVVFMAAVWSIRLAAHLGKRVLAHHPAEDGRYQQLRRDWAKKLKPTMFFFFEFQALLLVILSIPFFISARNPAPTLHPLEYAGLVIWFIAVAGETIADAQLTDFKKDTSNRGHVCRRGLWRYSRHPNYFFEWLVWVGFTVFAAASSYGWISLYCPILMLFFLTRVTGIRYTEDQLLRSKGEAYRHYQQTTSPFVPWFPRRIRT